MEVKDTYNLKLSPLQVDILMETIAGFVDNMKLLHIPDDQGTIVSLPLTMEVLQDVKSVMDKNESLDPVQIRIDMNQGDLTTILKLTMLDNVFEYDVKLDEFDPL